MMILVLCVLVAVYVVSRVPIVRANLPVEPGGSSAALWNGAILWTQGLLCVLLLGPIIAGLVNPLVIIAILPGALSALVPLSRESLWGLRVRESLHLVWFLLSVTVSYSLGGFAPLQDLLGA